MDRDRRSRARGAHDPRSHSIEWVPPRPDRWNETSARATLGARFPLWQRLGGLARKHPDIDWSALWKAAAALIEDGHAPRDGHIIERARQIDRYHRDLLERVIERRNLRRGRSTDGVDDSSGQGQ